MNRRKLFTGIVPFIIMVAAQHSMAQSGPIRFDSGYLPHHINDHWKYKAVLSSGNTYTYTVEITGRESFGGHDCMVYSSTTASTHSTLNRFYAFTGNDRIECGSNTGADNGYIADIPGVSLPMTNSFPQAGLFTRTFHEPTYADVIYDNCSYTYRLNGTDNFWFRAGSTQYEAIKLDYSENITNTGKDYNVMTQDVTEWYVKGIGLVYTEVHDRRTNAILQTTKLISAKIDGVNFR